MCKEKSEIDQKQKAFEALLKIGASISSLRLENGSKKFNSESVKWLYANNIYTFPTVKERIELYVRFPELILFFHSQDRFEVPDNFNLVDTFMMSLRHREIGPDVQRLKTLNENLLIIGEKAIPSQEFLASLKTLSIFCSSLKLIIMERAGLLSQCYTKEEIDVLRSQRR